MRLKAFAISGYCVTAATLTIFAQNPVTTTGGTANVVPKYSGKSTIVPSAIVEINGDVGIGTTAPTSPLHVVSTPTTTSGAPTSSFIQTTANPAALTSAAYTGLKIDTATKSGNTQSFNGPLFGSLSAVDHYGSGPMTSAYGFEAEVSNRNSATLTNAYALWLQLQNTGKGSITNGYGLRIGAPNNNGGGTLTNYYGIYIEKPTSVGTGYSVYSAGGTNYFADAVGIGTSTPSSLLTVNGVIQTLTGGIKFPDGTTQSTAQVKGPPGPLGPAGPAGPQGPTGPTGPAGNLALPYAGSSSAGVAFEVTSEGGSNGDVAIVGNGTAGASGIVASAGAASCYGENPPYSCISGGIGMSASGGQGTCYGDPSWLTCVPGGQGLVAAGGNGTVSGIPGANTNGSDGIDTTAGGGLLGGYGISATGGQNGDGSYSPAGYFNGDVDVTGIISNSGVSLKIDDPTDPANKYLSHSFVESPDMKNIYDGTITTDGRGAATVTLPDWFEALNRDFRYQLTVIGQFAQAIVETEIHNNTFTIRTDKPQVKVSWQVTGIRQDAYANAHRIPVEQDKPEQERNHYLHPELYGHSEEDSVLAVRNPRFFNLIEKQRLASEAKHASN